MKALQLMLRKYSTRNLYNTPFNTSRVIPGYMEEFGDSLSLGEFHPVIGVKNPRHVLSVCHADRLESVLQWGYTSGNKDEMEELMRKYPD